MTHWLSKLTPLQKDLLLECLATGECVGSGSPIETYTIYEGYLLDPYITPHSVDNSYKVKELRQAFIAYLPQTGPGYEQLQTEEDLRQEITNYYDKETDYSKLNSLSQKSFRSTPVFKYNLEVEKNRGFVESYRLMLKGSALNEDGTYTQGALSWNRFLLIPLAKLDEKYLKEEVELTDLEFQELAILKERMVAEDDD